MNMTGSRWGYFVLGGDMPSWEKLNFLGPVLAKLCRFIRSVNEERITLDGTSAVTFRRVADIVIYGDSITGRLHMRFQTSPEATETTYDIPLLKAKMLQKVLLTDDRIELVFQDEVERLIW